MLDDQPPALRWLLPRLSVPRELHPDLVNRLAGPNGQRLLAVLTRGNRVPERALGTPAPRARTPSSATCFSPSCATCPRHGHPPRRTAEGPRRRPEPEPARTRGPPPRSPGGTPPPRRMTGRLEHFDARPGRSYRLVLAYAAVSPPL